MTLKIFAEKKDCGLAAAKVAAAKIRTAIAERGECRIILATGISQYDMLTQLATEPGIDWGKVEFFHLDEYAGLPASHPASFRRFIKDRLIAKLPAAPKQVNYIPGDAADLKEALAALGAHLQEKPADVCFIGLGENGHIAFNDPPADFDSEDAYLVVKLDEVCRNQQLKEGWFATLEDVPTQAVSMSVRQILKSRSIINIVSDSRKIYAVQSTFEGELCPNHPASVIRLHPDCVTFCDVAAAAGLSKITRDFCSR